MLECLQKALRKATHGKPMLMPSGESVAIPIPIRRSQTSFTLEAMGGWIAEQMRRHYNPEADTPFSVHLMHIRTAA